MLCFRYDSDGLLVNITNTKRSTVYGGWKNYEAFTELRIRDATSYLDNQEYTCVAEALDGTTLATTTANVSVFEVSKQHINNLGNEAIYH